MTAADTLRANLSRIMREEGISVKTLADRSGVSPRTAAYLATRSSSAPSLDTAEAVAKALGLELWQLLLPDLDYRRARGALPAVLEAYLHAPQPVADFLAHIAEQPGPYRTK